MADTLNYAAYFEAIDLSTLSPPTIIEQLAYEDVFSELMRDFVSRDPEYTILLESDPAPKLLEVNGYREHLLRQAFNERAQQLLIAFAIGTNLDHLGAFYGVYRRVISEADNTTIPATPAVIESDREYRARIQIAPLAWSNAGPAGAYLFHTYASSKGVKDVALYTAASGLVKPGTVLVVIRVRDGFDADTTVKEVRARLFRDDVKPLTDMVQIKVAQPADFEIDATIYLKGGPDASIIRTQSRSALYEYISGINGRDKIGRLVAFSGIMAALNGTYVETVQLRKPSQDFKPGLTQYARLSGLNLEVVRV